MKNLILTLTVFFSSLTFAASDIRLTFEEGGLRGFEKIASFTITVDDRGLAKATMGGREVLLKVFLKEDMAEINSLIRKASNGTIERPDPLAPTCLAIPNAYVSNTADNGKVMLHASSFPCGGYATNVSMAAKELVEVGKDLKDILDRELDLAVLR